MHRWAIADVACSDADFGNLTSVVGMMNKVNGAFVMTEDIRFPAAITGSELSTAFEALSHAQGASIAVTACKDPFVVDPDTAPVRALMDAYCSTQAKRSVLSPWEAAPMLASSPNAVRLWPRRRGGVSRTELGRGMHAANEGIAEEELKRALRIYIKGVW